MENTNEQSQAEQTQTSNNSSAGQKPYNLDKNAEATLAYLIPVVAGVLVLLMEKNDGFVRFHAMQAVVFWATAIVVSFMLALIPLVNLFSPIYSMGVFLFWLYLMWQAYQQIEFEIPYLGKIARNLLNNQ